MKWAPLSMLEQSTPTYLTTWSDSGTQEPVLQIHTESGSGFRLFGEFGFRYIILITKNVSIFTVKKIKFYEGISRYIQKQQAPPKIKFTRFTFYCGSSLLYLAGFNPRIRITGSNYSTVLYYQIWLAMLCLWYVFSVYDRQGNIMVSDESHTILCRHCHLGTCFIRNDLVLKRNRASVNNFTKN